MISALAAAAELGLAVGRITAIIQGYGNVGSNSARLLAEKGVKIVGLRDFSAAIYDPEGLDLSEVNAHVKANSSLKGYPKAREISPKEDLLV